ncbi:MAG: septum formation protein Maf [Chlorobiaceae bacterium]|nr:septum formation protein Maf [Chlorobiaceae bacterium]
MPKQLKLILASRSPRRRELLALTGIPFETASVDIDETFDPLVSVEENVTSISRKKAEAVRASLMITTEEAVVLGSDTTVLLDDKPLGKPVDFKDAFSMLSALQGRTHEVLTGFCVLHGQKAVSGHARTLVEFEPISPAEIARYIELMQPYDKAGSYGIQDTMLACFIKRIDGCYYNVVGLPLSRVFAALKPLFPFPPPLP